MVLHPSIQSPYPLRNGLAQNNFKLEPKEIQVLVGDVGGSFGMKSGVQQEYALVCWAARKFNRPVRWISERTEGLLTDEQAREMRITAELALDAGGKFTALKLRWDANLGAYVSGRSGWPIGNIGGTAGVYDIPTIYAEACGIMTHTVPTAAYRGAGRPEATYTIERLIDVAARELGIEPVRTAPPQPDPSGGDAVQDRAHLHLRLRRIRRQHADCRGSGRTRQFPGAPRGSAAARQTARHRPVQLHRGRRRPVPASGEGHVHPAPRRGWHADPAHRFGVGRAGAGNRVQPDRRRPFRRAAGERALRTRQHRRIAVWQRQWRVGRAVHRRLGGVAGGRCGDRESQAPGSGIAGSRGGGRDLRCRPLQHCRHRSFGRSRHRRRAPRSTRSISRRARRAAWSKSGEFTPTACTFPNGTHICEVEIDPGYRRDRDRALQRGGGTRPRAEPDDRRRADAWRRGAGRRPGIGRANRARSRYRARC